jgi:hypothetical protein
MMNFFTKLLTPVFIALGMVNPTPVVETPVPNTQVQQEIIELRQKVQELENQVAPEAEKEVQKNTSEPVRGNTTKKSINSNVEIQPTNTKGDDLKQPLADILTTKIDSLRNKISFLTLLIEGNSNYIKEKRVDIDFHEKWLDKYQDSGIDQSAIDLNIVTYEAIVFWNQAIDLRISISNTLVDRMQDFEEIKQKLEADLISINSKNSVSDIEFKLRMDTLSNVADEKFYEKYEDQSNDISRLIDSYNKIDSDYSKLMKTMTLKTKNENELEMSRIEREIEKVKQITPPQPLPESNFDLRPTKVECYTSFGSPYTTCTESPSMKSMTCEASYGVYGEKLQSCYFK